MKIISGGQTGVDIGALDFAILRRMQYGGWVPKGRTNEDGEISAKYVGLIETESADNIERTRLNVGSSDATLIITDGVDSPGTTATERFARRFDKPFIVIDTSETREIGSTRLRAWLDRYRPAVLNVAGPRASESPDIYRKTIELLQDSLPIEPVHAGTLPDYLANIRHWDTIRWVVPFWYISGTLALLIGISSDKYIAQQIAPIMLVIWSCVGFSCAYLVSRTMKYHDLQREQLIRQFGRSALDPMSSVVFGRFFSGWRTATRLFWFLIILISLVSFCAAITKFGLIDFSFTQCFKGRQ